MFRDLREYLFIVCAYISDIVVFTATMFLVNKGRYNGDNKFENNVQQKVKMKLEVR